MATSLLRELLELSEKCTLFVVPRKGWAGKADSCCLACIQGSNFHLKSWVLEP